MSQLYNFLYALSAYRSVIFAVIVLVGLFVAGIAIYGAVMRLMEQMRI